MTNFVESSASEGKNLGCNNMVRNNLVIAYRNKNSLDLQLKATSFSDNNV